MSTERSDSMRLAEDDDIALTRSDIERARERRDAHDTNTRSDERRDDRERGSTAGRGVALAPPAAG